MADDDLFNPLDQLCTARVLSFMTCKDFLLATGTHRENECGETCTSSAKKGHINCLVSAYRRGGSWDRDTCAAAAIYGNV